MIVDKDVMVPTRDPARIAVRIYRPEGPGPFPALYAASPYRYDNDEAAYTALFPYRETGPIQWYVEQQGYAYVHADVRGAGRSEGEYGFLDRKESEAHYDVIEWIAAQPWSNGKVGAIGQSYYCMAAWWMGIENPPHLACIGAYDGLVDLYQFFGYTGGIESSYTRYWYGYALRPPNLFPANGAPGRLITRDFPLEVMRHPLYDDFWRERNALDHLERISAPLFSIGVWSKVDLHLSGNIIGYQRAQGPKKLYIAELPTVAAAHTEYAKAAFHEEFLLPFYDHYLKGKRTSYLDRPNVEFAIRNGRRTSSDAWPPPAAKTARLYLDAGPTRSVRSLNDGGLRPAFPGEDGGQTAYTYPDPHWSVATGVAVVGADGRPDTVRYVLTFTGDPLAEDIELVGDATLVLYFSSTATDTDFIVKLSEQLPRTAGDTAADRQPDSIVATKGWLRASHRALDQSRSRPEWPVYTHTQSEPLSPGRIYRLEIPLQPIGYRFRAGSRLRIEIANHDTPIIDRHFAHSYKPCYAGTDTIYHNAKHASYLVFQTL